jgi:dCMP deaminase
MLINSGIRRIIYQEGYPDKLAGEMLAAAGMKLERLESGDGNDAEGRS